MIASVVVTLDRVVANRPETLAAIRRIGSVEVGDFDDGGVCRSAKAQRRDGGGEHGFGKEFHK